MGNPRSPCVEVSFQHVTVVELQKSIQFLSPILEEYFLPSKVHAHRDDAIELADLGCMQIVLGHGHVSLLDAARLPGGQAHVRSAAVSALGNQFGDGLAGDGEVQLVLDEPEEPDGFRQRERE